MVLDEFLYSAFIHNFLVTEHKSKKIQAHTNKINSHMKEWIAQPTHEKERKNRKKTERQRETTARPQHLE